MRVGKTIAMHTNQVSGIGTITKQHDDYVEILFANGQTSILINRIADQYIVTRRDSFDYKP